MKNYLKEIFDIEIALLGKIDDTYWSKGYPKAKNNLIRKLEKVEKEMSNIAQQCYLECLATECGEGECSRAIATKFPEDVVRVEVKDREEILGSCKSRKELIDWAKNEIEEWEKFIKLVSKNEK